MTIKMSILVQYKHSFPKFVLIRGWLNLERWNLWMWRVNNNFKHNLRQGKKRLRTMFFLTQC